MTIQMIPLNQLVPSQANVRKTNLSAGIEELASSIEAHGLLQNLTVRAAPKGKFEVVAGGRRLAAMTILRRQKKMARDFPVPCHVIDEADAAEISLAENVVRLAMHPADQFDAFKGLADQGVGLEDIAARFGATPTVVRQRLKLASVSPVLIDQYREDEMNLDQLMAFTITDDHAAQEAAWFDCPTFRRDPRSIRATLTEAQVEADDRRVRFVGLDTYLAAGGELNRDLFQPEHEGYLANPALLDRLVAEKLEAAADEIRAEGWAWVMVMPVRDHAALAGCGRIRPTRVPLDPEQFEQIKGLTAECDALATTYGEEPEDEEIAQTLQSLWDEIDAIEATAFVWSADDKAMSGTVMTLGYDGELIVERGLVRPEDRRSQRSDETQDRPETGERPQSSGLSAALIGSLTADRTAALRAMLMDNQHVALASLAFSLALPLFYPIVSSDRAAMEVRLNSRDLATYGDHIAEGRAGMMLAERKASWEAKLPEEADDLFGWLLAQDSETLSTLLAYCAAQSFDAVRGAREWTNHPRHIHADAVADALHLDMREWWSPTTANYLGRVPKAMVLEAVKEAVSPQAAENLASLKKDRLAKCAEQRLAGTGWLPPLLRSPTPANAEVGEELKTAA